MRAFCVLSIPLMLFPYFMGSLIITIPLYLIIMSRGKGADKQDKALKKAITRGHVVEAEYKKQHSGDSPFSNQAETTLIYTYRYGGKEYKYRTLEPYGGLSPRITLYFVYFPWQAEQKGSLKTTWINFPILWLLVGMIVYLIFKAA